MIIRPASENDQKQILELIKQLVNYHAGLDRHYKNFSEYRGIKKYIRAGLNDSDKLFLIAEENNSIVGYLLASIEEAPFYSKEGSIGTIEDTFVEEKYRRMSILTKFFEKALKWFDKNGINVIELSVHSQNQGAIKTWGKLGFKTYRLKMRRKL